jgi:hypothetical protein
MQYREEKIGSLVQRAAHPRLLMSHAGCGSPESFPGRFLERIIWKQLPDSAFQKLRLRRGYYRFCSLDISSAAIKPREKREDDCRREH